MVSSERAQTPKPSTTLPILSSPLSDTTEIFSPPATNIEDADFVRITPFNPLARKHFDMVVTRMNQEAEWQRHARQFITSSKTSDGTYEGFYRLNMNFITASKQGGWVMGSGVPGEDRVDLLLTSQPHVDHVEPRHCRFAHNTKGLLMVEARHNIVVNGSLELGPKLLSKWHTVDDKIGISLGNLNYVASFTAFAKKDEYARQLARHQFNKDISRTLTPTPAPTIWGIYRIYNAGQGGANGQIAKGYNSLTGEGVVVKTIRRTNANYESVNMEVRVLRMVMEAEIRPNICGLVDVIGNEDLDRGAIISLVSDELRLIIAPQADTTLHAASLTTNQLLLGWRDCCNGLKFLHGQGITHRDIKPSNIGIEYAPSFKLIILDLGCASEKPLMEDHTVGTIPYLAPEVIALKAWSRTPDRSAEPPHYNSKVDVWALGLAFSWKQQGIFSWHEVSQEKWKERFTRRQNSQLHPDGLFLDNQILASVKWQAADRPTASSLFELADQYVRSKLKRPRPLSSEGP